MFWYRYNYLGGLTGSILGSCQAAKRCNKNWKEMWCCSALVTLVLFSCPAWLRHDTSRSCPALLCRAQHFFLSGSCLANVWLRERYSGQSQAGFRLWSVQKFRTGALWHHRLHEDVTPPSCVDSSEKDLMVDMFCSDLPLKRCERDLTFVTLKFELSMSFVSSSLASPWCNS